MKSYFLTLNPPKGDFTDYAKAVRLTSQGQYYPDDWRVRSRQIEPRDPVFVLRQGKSRLGPSTEGHYCGGVCDERLV